MRLAARSQPPHRLTNPEMARNPRNEVRDCLRRRVLDAARPGHLPAREGHAADNFFIIENRRLILGGRHLSHAVGIYTASIRGARLWTPRRGSIALGSSPIRNAEST